MTGIELKGVSSGYGQLSVLHDVTMEIETGEIVAIIGPNGAGKSTLLRAIFRLLPLHSGSIRFGDTELGDLQAGRLAQLGMGLVPQGGNTFPDLTVADNLSVGLLHESSKAQAKKIAEVFEAFPRLAERRRQRASTLSGGERQMLAMASAMITDPKFLALDEPTTGLAPSIVRERIADILRYRELGTTVLWVIEESPLLCLPHVDRVYVLNSGVLSESRPASDLLDESALQAMFFGVANDAPKEDNEAG
ncbi:MAG: branched-chain amino acid transport system ATP-binding protein [Verrucomicrobiales bacterium]|jgi:branched-chain amino acid transport system ATP-binding protein